MKKAALYSHSSRARQPEAPPARAAAESDAPNEAAPPAPALPRSRLSRFWTRFERPLLLAAGGLFAFALVAFHASLTAPAQKLTQEDIDAAVLHTLETAQLPSTASKAYEAVRRSVVRVRGTGHDKEKEGKAIEGVGSGVVIVDTGIILTNLHVVNGSKALKVVFHDGTESDAVVTGVQPEHDLAVLQAKTIPDDLEAATLRSTQGLRPGDPVVAVGFPFGIGPSVSAGVISGLGREYQNADGKRILSNLIQFDAAVNPGNSGGPLITPEGEVIGIVTGLLNPTEQRVFIGIGFAVPIENAAGAVGLSPF